MYTHIYPYDSLVRTTKSSCIDIHIYIYDYDHDFDAPAAPEGPVGPPIPDININLPNININIRQPRANVPDPPIGIPVVARSPAARADVPNPFARASRLNRSPAVGAPRQGNVEDWLAGQSPQHGPNPPVNPVVTPQVTRSGRISRPPERFSPTAEAKLQVDMRSALRKSLAEQRKADLIAAKDANIKSGKTTDAVKIPASRPPPTTVEPEKKKKSTASKPSTSKEFKVFTSPTLLYFLEALNKTY